MHFIVAVHLRWSQRDERAHINGRWRAAGARVPLRRVASSVERTVRMRNSPGTTRMTRTRSASTSSRCDHSRVVDCIVAHGATPRRSDIVDVSSSRRRVDYAVHCITPRRPGVVGVSSSRRRVDCAAHCIAALRRARVPRGERDMTHRARRAAIIAPTLHFSCPPSQLVGQLSRDNNNATRSKQQRQTEFSQHASARAVVVWCHACACSGCAMTRGVARRRSARRVVTTRHHFAEQCEGVVRARRRDLTTRHIIIFSGTLTLRLLNHSRERATGKLRHVWVVCAADAQRVRPRARRGRGERPARRGARACTATSRVCVARARAFARAETDGAEPEGRRTYAARRRNVILRPVPRRRARRTTRGDARATKACHRSSPIVAIVTARGPPPPPHPSSSSTVVPGHAWHSHVTVV